MTSTRYALIFAVSVGSVACGVGTYHIPDVAPVVTPEPEEDIFAGVEGLDDTSGSDSSSEETEEPAPATPSEEESKDSSEQPSSTPEGGAEDDPFAPPSGSSGSAEKAPASKTKSKK